MTTLYTKLLASSINLGTINGIGPLGNPNTPSSQTATQLTNFISNIIGLMTVIAGVYFLFQIFMAGYKWINAGGDKQAVQDAQKRLTNAFMGLLVVVMAFTITGVIGYFLGIPILRFGFLLLGLRP
ncbi:MAG: hypothetical protein UX91_C0001G0124 [Candidatus Amesbacteria bacterium GW2011_GWB1_47_19]|nr:MAG: hypothetical protein UW51_C0001G0124 [Candidatus Amesbacteria bacterium GW2011_GWA1_44_24]KKU32136.1 MAG: hypothetical protein UX46_C0001G0123 [Candidatus Amesbacteria bacterium GW2011_GWC1_46_24]KKU67820.1 MAG: hypothetical protein UX91_C0001G0124 [Candidatus Amesbacteria bacterium GW2011_GWB1_47_19]OGD05017.1 MAG: hypothetical protein A2379_03895 [Candidatus Amesbacteria bacterium RIFOXYB1_FULL_47_13]HBC72420.1 hypothetical protein [Candidatus Amesbacteria bacterium]